MTSDRDLAIVLWAGDLGGAELFTASLAAELRRVGVDARILFVLEPGRLGSRLDRLGVPFTSLGFPRGAAVLRHPRVFAAAVEDASPRWSLLVSAEFIGAALRAGGYRGTIVGIEHGELLFPLESTMSQRAVRGLSRRASDVAVDAKVGVSDFMVEGLRAAHARNPVRIHNAIDTRDPRWAPSDLPSRDRELVVGHAARLIEGKGSSDLIRAVADGSPTSSWRLAIAGEGPERPSLEALSERLGVGHRVTFHGLVEDISAFWRDCDVVAVPSASFIESFGMVSLEAMALARPVVATRNGALPEIVADGETGSIVDPGDSRALAYAIERYSESAELRRAHGLGGRARCERLFSMERCAREYLDLFEGLSRDRPSVVAREAAA